MEHFQQLVMHFIDQYGYGGFFVVMALGNIGAPIGSEVVLPLSGGLTATGHLPYLWATILVAVLGELAGGTVGYVIGRYGGRGFVDRFGKYVHLTHENLTRTENFFRKYGSFSIFICRFIPVIRGICSIPAGIAEMNLVHFYLWYAAGSLAFCGALILLGNAFGGHLSEIMPVIHKFGFGMLAIAVVAVAAAIVWRMTRKPKTA